MLRRETMTTTVRYTHVTCINRIKGRKRWYFVYIRWWSAVRWSCGCCGTTMTEGGTVAYYANVRSKAPLVNGWCVFMYVLIYIYIYNRFVCVGVGVCVSAHKLATRCTVVAKTFILFTISPQIPRVKRRPLTKPSLHPPITHETIRSTFGFLRRRRWQRR